MYFSAEEGELSIQELLDFLLDFHQKLYEMNRTASFFIKIGILRKS